MPDIGPLELIIIAVIVLLLFGPAKAADLGGALGKSIREFRKATHEEDSPTPALVASAPDVPADGGSASPAPVSSHGTRFCTECGAQNTTTQKFCSTCGASLVVASA